MEYINNKYLLSPNNSRKLIILTRNGEEESITLRKEKELGSELLMYSPFSGLPKSLQAVLHNSPSQKLFSFAVIFPSC